MSSNPIRKIINLHNQAIHSMDSSAMPDSSSRRSLRSEPSDQRRALGGASMVSSLKELSFRDEKEEPNDVQKLGSLVLKNELERRKDEFQILKTLVLINVAVTSIVLLLLLGFGVAHFVTRPDLDEAPVCDCECFYQFPAETEKDASTVIDGVSNWTDSFNSTGEEDRLVNATTNLPLETVPPTTIQPQDFLSSNEQLKQAVAAAKEASYDPSAQVFATYGYPMGSW